MARTRDDLWRDFPKTATSSRSALRPRMTAAPTGSRRAGRRARLRALRRQLQRKELQCKPGRARKDAPGLPLDDLASEALALGHACRRGPAQAPAGLSRRVRLPPQPAQDQRDGAHRGSCHRRARCERAPSRAHAGRGDDAMPMVRHRSAGAKPIGMLAAYHHRACALAAYPHFECGASGSASADGAPGGTFISQASQ